MIYKGAQEMFDPTQHRLPNVEIAMSCGYTPGYSDAYASTCRRGANELQAKRFTSTTDP